MSEPKSVTRKVPDLDGPLSKYVPSDATRPEAAVALKLAGASYETIAERLDFPSVADARHSVEKALADSASEYSDRDRLRLIMNRQMDRIMSKCFQESMRNGPDSMMWAKTWLSFSDRKSRLNGLDAPVEVHTTITPAYDEIMAWASNFAAQVAGKEIVIEADIFDDRQIGA